MDDALLDLVIRRMDSDAKLSTEAADLLLAACQGDHALDDALGGSRPGRPEGSSAGEKAQRPLGAFLRSITVEGFRGIGPAATLTLQPGPGLTLIVGRNGSGKSSFAEGLEVLLTGTTARFQTFAVFRDGWRNLHQDRTARVAAQLHVEDAPGTTTIERTWPSGAALDQGRVTVQKSGDARRPGLEGLGWSDHLVTYRPFLAHSELESMFGSPSALHERLAAVLGLGAITDTQNRLGERRRSAERTVKDSHERLKALLVDLEILDDERASKCAAALRGRSPDLGAVEQVVVGTEPPEAGGVLDVLRRLATLSTPSVEEASLVAQELRDAADALGKLSGTEAGRARSLADLLSTALEFHAQHPADADCPVCGRSDALDDSWRQRATTEVAELRSTAAEAEDAHRRVQAAARRAATVIGPAPDVLTLGPGAGIDTEAIRSAWHQPPVPGAQDDPVVLRAMADELELTAEAVDETAGAVRRSAAAALDREEDRWKPVAARVAEWLPAGRAGASLGPRIKLLKAAENWLKEAHEEIRNDRLGPIAIRAQEVWRELRHESNVDLGEIRLAGAATRKRVDLHVTVDGTEGAALGVMSQGEVNALALSIFLPRVTLPESPFRFVVIDDPVQAMDPAKVEGLAKVLSQAGDTHQVLVFTHDDRLPSAVRRLGLPARILQVHRRHGSVVEIVSAADPVTQALAEARAVATTPDADPFVVARVVPGACRLALEAALNSIITRRLLAAGVAHAEVEERMGSATTTTARAALALFGSAQRGGEVLGRLNGMGRHIADTFQALKRGAHGELVGSPIETVAATERLIQAVEAATR